MERNVAVAALVLALLVGCANTDRRAKPRAVRQQRPTAERLIVLNTIDRGGGLIFGGPDGKRHIRLRNDNARAYYARYAISPNARVAACISYDGRTEARWVTFFDCSGNKTANVMLPQSPKTKSPWAQTTMRIFLSNRSEAVVAVVTVFSSFPCLVARAMVSPGVAQQKMTATGEWYYVLPSGTTKPIKADPYERIDVLFPDAGGMALLRRKGTAGSQRPWRIERYDKGMKLRWEKTLKAQYIGPLKPKYDLSVWVNTAQGRHLMHFHPDGRSEIEPVPRPPPPPSVP